MRRVGEVTLVAPVTRVAARMRSLVNHATFVTLASLASFAASAAEKPFAAPQVTEHAPVATAGSLAQVTVSLLLVLAAVFAAAWVVRRLRGFGKFGANAIRIIADAPLGTKERAVLIQVGNQQLLLGVAPGRVNMLHVLTELVDGQQATGDSRSDTASAHAHAPSPVSDTRPDFKAILKRSLGL